MPLFERTGHFHRWRPCPFDSPAPKTHRRVTLSWRPWPWFRGKTSKTWVESLPRKVKLSTFSWKRYTSAKNDPRSLKLGSKYAGTCPLSTWSRAFCCANSTMARSMFFCTCQIPVFLPFLKSGLSEIRRPATSRARMGCNSINTQHWNTRCQEFVPIFAEISETPKSPWIALTSVFTTDVAPCFCVELSGQLHMESHVLNLANFVQKNSVTLKNPIIYSAIHWIPKYWKFKIG